MTIETNNTNETNETALTIRQAKQPDELTTQQINDINNHCDKAINALVKSKGDIFSNESDLIVNIGVQDQKSVSSKISLLQERMNDVFYNKEKSNVTDNMSKDISELQKTLAKINPKDIQDETKYKLIALIPFFGNKIVTILKDASNKGMTLQQFVEHLDESLKHGEIMLRQNNADLKVMNDELKQQQVIIRTNAYTAEILMNKLSDIIKEEKDEILRNNLNEVLFKVTTRAQDLRAMENINEQFFAALKMTRSNNDLLIDGAKRMETMGMTVVNISMAIHVALINAKNVKDVEVGTGQFIGKMLISNATVINGMVTEIGDLYKNPFVPMKMLEDAVGQLEQAIDNTNKLKSESIEMAKNNITKIKVLNNEIRTKSGKLIDTEVKSIEASEIIELPEGRS